MLSKPAAFPDEDVWAIPSRAGIPLLLCCRFLGAPILSPLINRVGLLLLPSYTLSIPGEI